jgi:HAD superfamily hydrolase (TIGR01484 family)
MTLIPLSAAIATQQFSNIHLVATDMDGTLSEQEKFTPHLLQALGNLAAARVQVLIVTGRSAGWVSGIVSYLPVWGAIAENGGVFYHSDPDDPGMFLPAIADITQHRQKLAKMFYQLQATFPQIRETSDNRFRLTDWTFDVKGLSLTDLETMAATCQTQGLGFTYSTVQCHIKLPTQEKASGLLQILTQFFPEYSLEQVVTVGDSRNDESLFDPKKFPYSVGVANVLNYADQLVYQPAYVTTAAEGSGFCELADLLCKESGRAKSRYWGQAID